MTTKKIIQELLNLQKKYSRTYRATLTNERLSHSDAQKNFPDIDVKRNKFREPLLEHVGHLPVIASFLHPHIENSKKVDLGRVLTMLSIHDIGETITGEFVIYNKTSDQDEEESNVARDLLPAELASYFDEFEKCKTLDAKYAKSIDCIAPFFHELSMPKLTTKRFEVYNFGTKDIQKKKGSLFEWDPVLADIFDFCLDIFKRVEKGESINLDTELE